MRSSIYVEWFIHCIVLALLYLLIYSAYFQEGEVETNGDSQQFIFLLKAEVNIIGGAINSTNGFKINNLAKDSGVY